jgi:hypothetical protein
MSKVRQSFRYIETHSIQLEKTELRKPAINDGNIVV